jgi:prevent-host-death family protein
MYNKAYKELPMPVKPSEDIQPLSTFRAHVASFVEQVRQTRRPLVLTQHGQSTAVLLGVAEYEALIEELEVLRDVVISERELAEGRTVPHEQVVEELRAVVRSRTDG